MSAEATSAVKQKTQLEKDWAGMLFGVRRSVRYHTRRRCFFERIGFFTKFLAVILGSGTGIVAIIGRNNVATAWLGFFTAALSAADLIIGYASKARLYHDLSRKFIELEKEMVLTGNEPTPEKLKEVTGKRLTIEADEPPKISVLDLLCHNEVVRAMYGYKKEEHTYSIPTWKRLLCHFHDFDRSDCLPRGPIQTGPQSPQA